MLLFEAHWELTFLATSYTRLCLDQFKHLWKGGNKLFCTHHCLDHAESYISKLLENLREAENLDTPTVIQHDQWVDQFMALRAQLEADKEKEETEKRFPAAIKPLRRLNPQRNFDFWKKMSNMLFSRWRRTKRLTVSVFWTVWL